MLLKFLEEVVAITVGKQAEVVATLLNNPKHVNEFIIAKKMDITINQTRNILYKLSDHGLVSSIRKKDKRKGWYTYFWRIEILKSLEFLKSNLLRKLEQIQSQVKSRETKEFYFCERCNIEFNAENALLNDFTCNECGGIFTLKDNTKVLREMKKNCARIERELEGIEVEVQKERDKLDKKKAKELKKVEKEKKLKRAQAAAKRKRAKKAVERAAGKISKKIKKRPKKRKVSGKKKILKKSKGRTKSSISSIQKNKRKKRKKSSKKK